MSPIEKPKPPEPKTGQKIPAKPEGKGGGEEKKAKEETPVKKNQKPERKVELDKNKELEELLEAAPKEVTPLLKGAARKPEIAGAVTDFVVSLKKADWENPDKLGKAISRLAREFDNAPEDTRRLIRPLISAARQKLADLYSQQLGVNVGDPQNIQKLSAEQQGEIETVLHDSFLTGESGMARRRTSSSRNEEEDKNIPQFTLVESEQELRDLSGDVKKTIEGMRRVLEKDPLQKASTEWTQKAIENLDGFVATSAKLANEVEPYLERLQRHLSELQKSNKSIYGRNSEWLEEQAKVAAMQQRLSESRKALERNLGVAEGEEITLQHLRGIQDKTLGRLSGEAFVSWHGSEYSGNLQRELQSLISRSDTHPDNPILKDEDRKIADALSEYLSAKQGITVYSENVYRKVSEEDLKRFFNHVGYRENDIEWIFETMSKPVGSLEQPGLLQTLGISNGRFEHGRWQGFEREVERQFYKMFEGVNRQPTEAFEEWFTMFYHRPVYQTFMDRLGELREGIHDLYRNARRGEIAKCRIEGKDVEITELVDKLFERLRATYVLQEYAHNAFYIFKSRGEFKSLAGYANKLSSEVIDMVFKDKKIQAAYHFFEQILRHELGWNQWATDARWFQFTVNKLGDKGYSELISDRVAKLMREHFPELREAGADWEVKKAVALARGSIFGVTASGIDLLAEAERPRGIAPFAGYFADRILWLFNPTRHFFFRWWPTKAHRHISLLYTKIRFGGVFGEGWDPKKLDKWQERYAYERLTNLRQYKDSVRPFIHISNLFRIGSIDARGGWRAFELLKEIFDRIPKTIDGKIEFSQLQAHHLEHTRTELEQTGLNYLYFWAKQLDGAVNDGKLSAELVVNARLTMKDVYLAILRKDPLYFLTRDSTLWNPKNIGNGENQVSFKDTIRGKALTKLGGEWSVMANNIIDPLAHVEPGALSPVETLRKQLDPVEQVLMSATEVMVRLGKTQWDTDVTRALRAKFAKEQLVKTAKSYYDAIQEVVQNQTMRVTHEGKKTQFREVTEEKIFLDEFLMREVPYSVGTITVNFDKVRYANAGQDVVARNFDDEQHIAEGAIAPILYFDSKLDNLLASHGDMKEFDDYLRKAKDEIEYVHGIGKEFYDWSYMLNLMTNRFLQKAWWARLPLGLGNASRFLVPLITRKHRWAAYSQNITQSALTTAWDESNLWVRVHNLREAGMLSPEYAEKMELELGAQPQAVGRDTVRSYSPWVVVVAGLAGITLSRKDQKEE